MQQNDSVSYAAFDTHKTPCSWLLTGPTVSYPSRIAPTIPIFTKTLL
jgi:hypothetical protein